MPSSINRDYSHRIFTAVSARDLYTASIEELAIVLYFLVDHEILFWPIKIAYPPVDRLLTPSPAQFENNKRRTLFGKIQSKITGCV